METPTYIVDKILQAESYIELFEDLKAWKETYKIYAKQIHPDICKDPNCQEAIIKLNLFKEQLENGTRMTDGISEINYHLFSCHLKADEKIIENNFKNYLQLKRQTDDASKHFHQYLPEQIHLSSSVKIELNYPKRSVPLSAVKKMEIKHVNWILSRLLELTAWFNQSGYCHAGINPDSIFVIPENHGILCISFYHMTFLDDRLKTISGKYSSFYPVHVMSEKMATSDIDITLCKKTAIWLLGDESGNGSKLRGMIPEEYLDFLQKIDYDPLSAYHQLREILEKNYNTKEFHQLKI